MNFMVILGNFTELMVNFLLTKNLDILCNFIKNLKFDTKFKNFKRF